MSERKIVQIETDWTGDRHGTAITALCDDGTVWFSLLCAGEPWHQKMEKVPGAGKVPGVSDE